MELAIELELVRRRIDEFVRAPFAVQLPIGIAFLASLALLPARA